MWIHKMKIDLVIGLILAALVAWLLGPYLTTLYTVGFIVDVIRWFPMGVRGYILLGVPALLMLAAWSLVAKLLGGVDDFFEGLKDRRSPGRAAPKLPDLKDAPAAPVALVAGSYIPCAVDPVASESEKQVAELRAAAGDRLSELLTRRVGRSDKVAKDLVGYGRDFMDHDGVLGAVVVEGVDGTSEFDDSRMPRLGVLTVIADGAAELYREGVPAIFILRAARSGKSVIDGRPNKFWHRELLASWKEHPW